LAPAAGTAAAVGTAVQLDRLVAQGHPTISFLALNAAIAPEVANDPNAQAIRGTFANAYYTTLQTTLAGYAANGSIVHYLDAQVLGAEVAANPKAFGITKGLVCPIFPDPTCLIDSSGYLFYGDALHLTSQGFAIVAQYVARQLAAPLTLQAPSSLGVESARQFGRTLSTRSDLYGRGGATGLNFFAVGDYFSSDVGETAQNAAFQMTGGGGTVGVEYGLPMAVVGVAGNYSKPRLRFGNDSARMDTHSWQVGAYGSLAAGPIFGQAYLGYGSDHNELTRVGVVSDMTASPHGHHVTAGAKAGYLMPMGPLSIGPVAAVDYARANVQGYTENGDPVLTLNVSSQSQKSMTGQLGIEARGALGGLRPYAAVTAEHEFSGNGGVIHFSQTDAPVIVNSWDSGRSKGTYGRLAVGAAANVAGSLSVDSALTTTFGRNGGQEVAAHVGVRASF